MSPSASSWSTRPGGSGDASLGVSASSRVVGVVGVVESTPPRSRARLLGRVDPPQPRRPAPSRWSCRRRAPPRRRAVSSVCSLTACSRSSSRSGCAGCRRGWSRSRAASCLRLALALGLALRLLPLGGRRSAPARPRRLSPSPASRRPASSARPLPCGLLGVTLRLEPGRLGAGRRVVADDVELLAHGPQVRGGPVEEHADRERDAADREDHGQHVEQHLLLLGVGAGERVLRHVLGHQLTLGGERGRGHRQDEHGGDDLDRDAARAAR